VNVPGIRTRKRAPSIALGVLLFFAVPSFCGALEELSLAETSGNLWAEEGGAVWYWFSGLSYRPVRGFHLEAAAGGINSSLPWVKIDMSLFAFRSGVDFDWFGIHLFGNFLTVRRSDLEIGDAQLYNEGGGANLSGVSLPLYFGPFVVTPFFLTGSGYLNDGSLYWFFGKPIVPLMYSYGLTAGYAGTHLLELRYFRVEPEIRSNYGDLLFAAVLSSFLASYTFKFGPPAGRPEGEQRRFEGTAGWLYTGGSAGGALTASNQRYALFPFNFFSITGSLDAHLTYGMVRFLFRPSIFQFDISLGAVHILWGEANAGYQFKMKRLFGGSEFQEELGPVGLSNTGAAFLLLDGGIVLRIPYQPVPFGISLGIRKAFVVPWGYEKYVPGGFSGIDSASASPAFDSGLLHSILLSGLSVYARISW
jgi:hypothetical protein